MGTTNYIPVGIKRENVKIFTELIDAASETTTPCSQDPEMWFSTDPAEISQAKRMCAAHCPIKALCLEYAVRNRENVGVWGGVSAARRASIYNEVRATESDIDDV